MQVRMFSDVDGALNAIEPDDLWPDYKEIPFPGAINNRLIWSPTMIEHLISFDFEWIWATAWLDAAAPYLAPVFAIGHGAPHLPPLNGIMDFPTIYWKRESVQAYVEANPGPFIWIDDEMRPEDSAWAASVGGLALATPVWHGVTPHQIELMREYIDSLS